MTTASATLSTFLGDVTTVVTSAFSWVGTVGSTIMSTPVLIAGVSIVFVGLGIGLFGRMLNLR